MEMRQKKISTKVRLASIIVTLLFPAHWAVAGNDALSLQMGNNNDSWITQGEGFNVMVGVQDGNLNKAYLIQQTGYSNNEAIILQIGTSNKIGHQQMLEEGLLQNGNSNFVRLLQYGEGNTAILRQNGNDNKINLKQWGNTNTANITQNGNNLEIRVTQRGTGLTYTVTQTQGDLPIIYGR